MKFETVEARGNWVTRSEVELNARRIVGWGKAGFDQERQEFRWKPILDNGVTLDIEITQASMDAWRGR